MKVIQTTGKRKKAIAKAVVRDGKGRIRINKKPLENLEPELARMKITEPLTLSGIRDKIDIDVSVNGGGFMGQAEAIRTAIGKALIESSKDKALRDMFYEYDRTLVKDDVRRKESKKYGGKGARSKKQKSYR